MHDGSQKTLEEVVEWYNKGGHPNPHLDEKIKKLDLTDQEKVNLVAFMKALTGELPKPEPAGYRNLRKTPLVRVLNARLDHLGFDNFVVIPCGVVAPGVGRAIGGRESLR